MKFDMTRRCIDIKMQAVCIINVLDCVRHVIIYSYLNLHMSEFAESLRERAKILEQSKHQDQLFALTHIPAAIARLNISNPSLTELAQKLIQGTMDTSFNLPLVTNAEGGVCLDMSRFGDVLKSADLHKDGEMHVFAELFVALDQDMVMRGETGASTREFQRKRAEIAKKVYRDLLAYNKKHVNFTYRLASEECPEPFEKTEDKECFAKMEACAQAITDRLFLASGLKKYKPKVLLTRDTRLNAFVFGIDTGKAIREFAEDTLEQGEQIELPIFIHTGLIAGMKNQDELAGVLAHEFSHLLQPTYNESYGGKSEELSKRLEYGADATGMQLADAAGFNPRALIDVFRAFPDEYRMEILFGGSHPATQDRIIELEKLFHRTDVPFANAQKPATDFDPDMHAVAKEMCERKQKKPIFYGKEMRDAENDRSLESFILGVENPQDLLSTDNIHTFAEVLKQRSEQAFTSHEFQTGEFGYSQILSEQLTAVVKMFQKFGYGNQVGAHGNEYRYLFPKWNEADLIAPIDDAGSYRDVHWDTGHPDFENLRKWHLEKKLQRDGISLPDQASSLESWLDCSIPESKVLWGLIESSMNRSLSNEERRHYLFALLRSEMHLSMDPSSYGKFGVTKIVETKQIVKKTRLVSSAQNEEENAGHLSKLHTLHGRVQVKKAQVITPQYEEYDEEYVSFRGEELFSSLEVKVDVNFNPKLFVIGEDRAPMIQDSVDAYAKKGREALRVHLSERGITEVDDQDLDFLLRAESTFTPFDREVLNLYRIQKLLTIVESPLSLGDLFQNAEASTRKDNYSQVISQVFNQHRLRNNLLRLGAFAFVPKTQEDHVFQQSCLRRIELDPRVISSDARYVLGRDPLTGRNEFTSYVINSEDDLFYSKVPENRFVENDDVRLAMHMRLAPMQDKYANFVLGEASEDVCVHNISDSRDAKYADIFSDTEMQKHFSRIELERLKITSELFLVAVRGFARDYFSEGVLLPETLRKEIDIFFSFYEDSSIFQSIIDRVISAQEISDQTNPEEGREALKKWFNKLAKKAFNGKEYIYLVNLIHKSQRDQVKSSTSRIDAHLNASMDWLPYRPHGLSSRYEQWFAGRESEEVRTEENKRFLDVLEAESVHDVKKAKIFAFVQRWQAEGKLIGPMMRSVCMGAFIPYQDYQKEMPFSDIVSLWRTVAEVYKEEWKNIEPFKSLDQQLSHWEWQNHNPLIKFGWDKKGKTNRLKETLAYFSGNGGYEVGKVYAIDANHLNEVLFSWPLFLEDVMNDQVTYPADFKYSGKMHQAEFKQKIQNLKHEITKLIESRDPKVMETILAMQPGFFKEFLLSRKIKKGALKTLEQVEAWLPHFSSQLHEGTGRNQITAHIETNKQKITEETKIDLMRQAMRELGFSETTIASAQISIDLERSLTGHECYLRLPDYENDPGWDSPEKRKERYEIYQRYLGAVYNTYHYLLRQKQHEVRDAGLVRESDVHVFSDQVIEDDKNKLHIGPAYRLRMVSQVLMDWHVSALEGTATAEETKTLLARIDHNLPEKHPLKDIFIKNNLMVELWQMIKESLGQEKAEELGITLEKKTVDLNEVLEKLPLYKEASFLTFYAVFELSGLEKAISELPKELAKNIRDRVEHAMNEQISPDQFEGMRRMLMEVEKRTVWPELKSKRKGHPEVFEDYIARITALYKEPSYARDEILESICMDIATTPEQIKAVWALRYDEQMRLPNDQDTTETKGQFHALEKMKAGLSFANTQQRAEYLIWFLGGEAPLAESFASEKMNISLLDRKDLFWSLSPVERKSFLYDLLLGHNGVMEIDPKREESRYGDYDNPLYLTDNASNEELEKYRQHRRTDGRFTKWERPGDMVRYVADQVFTEMFGNQRMDAKLPADHETNVKGKELIQTIFRELFVQQKEPARRAELFANIIEAIGGAQRENMELTPGKLIKLLLEQVGVVGIKAGQVLSEQPDLLPESIRQELAGLKDQTTPFSKRGVLTYLEAANLVHADEPRISQIGNIVGSASIKQVLEGVLEGKRVAIKARRPSIDKNFEEDLEVLDRVFKRVEAEGFELPSYLLGEVERLSRDELNFAHEVDHQRAFEASLKKRDAHIGLETDGEYRSLPLMVAEVYVPPNSSEEDTGLIVEEFVRGFSLKELYAYRTALQTENATDIEKYREKAHRIYGDDFVESLVEKRIGKMDLERFQANLGVELLQQIQDGVLHSDLHSGNVYIDPHPLDGRAILIDLGSVGYSEKTVMPEYLQAETEDGFDAKSDFRDFITAFFGENLRYDVIATVVQKYTSRTWTEADIRDIVGDVTETDGKVNKIFYALLKGGAEMHSQFRYLLKAIATGAGHLDQLKHVSTTELSLEEEPEHSVTKALFEKGLINVEMLFG